MQSKIDHIAIAVRSLKDSLEIYATHFGLRLESIEEIRDQKTRVALLSTGDSHLELIEAMGDDSPVAKFIDKRGEGLHHICFWVEDIVGELERLNAAGVRLVDKSPRRGSGGRLIAFVHPSSTGGVLIELAQRAQDSNHLPSE